MQDIAVLRIGLQRPGGPDHKGAQQHMWTWPVEHSAVTSMCCDVLQPTACHLPLSSPFKLLGSSFSFRCIFSSIQEIWLSFDKSVSFHKRGVDSVLLILFEALLGWLLVYLDSYPGFGRSPLFVQFRALMDPAQGETGGGRTMSSKPAGRSGGGVKDKIKNLTSRFPGMKKHGGEEEIHDDGYEYDENSPTPRGSVPETGNHVADYKPYTAEQIAPEVNSPKISPRVVHYPDAEYRPTQSGYDSQNRNYVTASASPPTRPAPLATDTTRSYMPSDSPRFYTPTDTTRPYSPNDTSRSYSPTDAPRSYTPTDAPRSYTPTDAPRSYTPTDAPRSYTPTEAPRTHVPPALEEKFQHLGVGERPLSGADPIQADRDYFPEQTQQYPSPSTTESIQKGYSDVPRNSYRSTSMPAAAANKGVLEKVKLSVAGATVALGDKMGYYNDYPPANPNAPSILSRAKSTLGMDKPRDPNAPPLTEKAKIYMGVAGQKTREYSATAADHAAWTRDRVAAQTTPTHHHKALSEQVTQSLDNLPGMLKQKMFGPAPPSTGAATGAPTGPGIVDRVSGAVSSLFTTAAKPPGSNVQHTFPAHPDYHGPTAGGGYPSAPVDRIIPERVPATSGPSYSSVNY